MPNIELHGFSAPETMITSIFDLFKDRGYVDEMVVTICRDTVVDRSGKTQPFFRLANSCQEHTSEIIEKLRTLHFDIERLILDDFIPGTMPANFDWRSHLAEIEKYAEENWALEIDLPKDEWERLEAEEMESLKSMLSEGAFGRLSLQTNINPERYFLLVAHIGSCPN